LKFVHIGDTHLGYRQYGLRVREEDYTNAVRHVVDRSIEIGVDAVIWPGDVFDSPTPPARAVEFVKDQVWRLKNNGIVSIGIDGNHDATDGKWMRVCGIETFDGAFVEVGGIAFLGLNYERPGPFKEKLEALAKSNPKVDVLIIHQPLGDLTAFGCEITAAWIAETFKKNGLKYVALGDIHNFGTWDIDGVTFVYPGSVEMTDIDEDEGKHFVTVEINEGKVTTFVESTNPRPIVRYEVTTGEDLEHVFDDVQGAYGGHVLPVVRLNSDLPAAVVRLQKEFGGKVPYRLQRFSEDTGQAEQILDRNWTRVGLIDLISVVEESFAKESEEYQLIVNMIDNPEQVLELAEQFIINKGLAEVCQL
jgi:DNA repair exonuclease SbcCD nuclease subunit